MDKQPSPLLALQLIFSQQGMGKKVALHYMAE